MLGLAQGATGDIPPMLGQSAATLTVDLDQFHPDGERSWTGTGRSLLDRYGPFTLAYLETVVRVATGVQAAAGTPGNRGRNRHLDSIDVAAQALLLGDNGSKPVAAGFHCAYRRRVRPGHRGPGRAYSPLRGGGAGACGSPRAAATSINDDARERPHRYSGIASPSWSRIP